MPVPTTMKAFTFQNKCTICETHQYAGSQTTKSQTSLHCKHINRKALICTCHIWESARCCILLSFTAFGFKMWSCWYMHALQWPQGGDLCWLQKDFQSQKSMGLPWPLYTLYCWLHRLLALEAFIYLWLRVYDFVKATSTEDRTILYCILLYFV